MEANKTQLLRVVVGEMEEIPVTGLEELEKHVDVLLEAPDTPLDAKLFDEVELQLNGRFVSLLKKQRRLI